MPEIILFGHWLYSGHLWSITFNLCSKYLHFLQARMQQESALKLCSIMPSFQALSIKIRTSCTEEKHFNTWAISQSSFEQFFKVDTVPRGVLCERFQENIAVKLGTPSKLSLRGSWIWWLWRCKDMPIKLNLSECKDAFQKWCFIKFPIWFVISRMTMRTDPVHIALLTIPCHAFHKQRLFATIRKRC